MSWASWAIIRNDKRSLFFLVRLLLKTVLPRPTCPIANTGQFARYETAFCVADRHRDAVELWG
jgi:hypothetical protein